jgi:ABC-type bacteriocin/lantibiotic exporter with double-glycine peptidase domain
VSSRYRRTPVVPQMEQQDCGGACLVSVLAAFGKHVSLHEANRACGVTRDGVTAAALVRAAGSYGLKSSAKRVRRDNRKAHDGLAALAAPSVVLMTGPHFAVFEGIRRGMARVNDPSLGRYAVRPDEFWAKFAGIAVGFTPGPDFRAGGRRFPLARDLAARVRPFFGPLAAAVGIALLVSAPGVAAALLFRSATAHAGQATSTTDTATLFAVAAAACAC